MYQRTSRFLLTVCILGLIFISVPFSQLNFLQETSKQRRLLCLYRRHKLEERLVSKGTSILVTDEKKKVIVGKIWSEKLYF